MQIKLCVTVALGFEPRTLFRRNVVKVVKSIKDPNTGKYTYKELMIHKDKVKEFFAENK